ncbi:MAG: ABC-F family ATP-binding cassette domain-containing protein [Treponema sp.]|jgi:ATP-binding cassette subfamily F protein uup|nr:ABC-F family ATP-binding cassette domain-containing protein [Treponema sp.]
MNILSMSGAAVALKDGYLFEDLDLGLKAGEHIGLVGKNGCGKTTLLRLIAGRLESDRGSLARRRDLAISSLEQIPQFEPGVSLSEFLYSGDAPEIRLRLMLKTARGRELARVEKELEALGPVPLENRYASLCAELGLADMEKPLATMSGGEVKKAALARTLAPKSDLVLLDEPTNHLDLDSIEWLETRLLNAGFAFVLVTHDRWFLDAVADAILEIDRRRVFRHPGNYSAYLERKAERWASLEAAEQRRAANLKIEMAWLMRGARARATKSERRKDEIKAMQASVLERPASNFVFSSAESRLGKKAVKIDKLGLRYGERRILKPFSYEIAPGARLGVVGPNGCGKTSLLDMIGGRLEVGEGSIVRGDTVRISYFEQDGDSIPQGISVLDYIRDHAERLRLSEGAAQDAALLLERFGFDRDFQALPVERLSGGERRRLQLVRILAEAPNFLLLDEPTNDLDIETIEALEEFLEGFQGCIVAVSHDRAFLDRIARFLLVIEPDGKVSPFNGSYLEWREARSDRAEAPGPRKVGAALQGTAAAGAAPARRPKKLSFAERRELEGILPRIDELESEKANLEALFARAGAAPQDIRAGQLRYHEVLALIESLSLRWEELAQKDSQA